MIRKDEEGFLSAIDALIFCVILLLISISLFNIFNTTSSNVEDLESREMMREATEDIQDSLFNAEIRDVRYFNNSKGEEVNHKNMSVERALKLYLYLDHQEENSENSAYNLAPLANQIEEKYHRGARELSKYNFALKAEYESSELFLSNKEVGAEEELPAERSAYTSFTTIRLEPAYVTLFLWR